MLNACLSHSWPNKSFRPQSRVAQLRFGTWAVKVCTLEAVRMCREPMAWVQGWVWVLSFLTDLLYLWGYGAGLTHDLDLSCTKGDPMWPWWGEYGCVLGIIPQLGRNGFESSSLPDSENLTWAPFIIVIDESVGYVGYENAQLDMVTIVMI